jgi:mannose-6-phosphate isomerase-like protein (cupin superfamily)
MKPQIRIYKPGAEYWFPEGCHIDELLNDPNDPVVSIARARVPAGGITRWHRVRDAAERYLIESGRGRVEIGMLDPREVGPGDIVIIPPGCRQRIANLTEDDLVFLAICTPRFQEADYEDLEAGSAD